MWSMLTHSLYTKVDSAHRLAHTHHVTERYAFSTSLRNKTSNLITSNLWLPGHRTIGWAVWANFHAQHEVSTRADWSSLPPPDQCGYACLLCLNSGSVAPLVGLSIMMRIISCSVKGYTSLSLDAFVPKHPYMHVCVCVTIFILQLQCSKMQHMPTLHWRVALYKYLVAESAARGATWISWCWATTSRS